jgi:hypothetical protein
MNKFHHAFVALGLFLLVGCGPSDQSEKKQQSDADAKMMVEQTASEKQLLADPSRATPELIQRLRASVKMRDGLLMMDDQSYTRLLYPRSETYAASIPGAVNLSVRPPEAPWVFNCGMGITVVFGNQISGGPEPIINDFTVWLTYVPVPKQACELLAPVIGKEIQAILSGR